MRKLSAFNFITLNGYFHGPEGDISWHRHGAEENQFAAESMKAENTLLFGRKTYEMMAGYWPGPMAIENDREVAEGMNNADKIVVTRTLKNAAWNNTRILTGDLVTGINRLKASPGNNITLLGSGSILTQLAENGLIDEYLVMIDPVAIGAGTPIFDQIGTVLNLKLTQVKSFKSGVVLLGYVPC
ncbi:MAG: dihydrofolate reductase [Bacteroidales bacterium]|nr:dihydrofolate reductase [Bacteroidales bacterium]